jgi:hypothetical protein
MELKTFTATNNFSDVLDYAILKEASKLDAEDFAATCYFLKSSGGAYTIDKCNYGDYLKNISELPEKQSYKYYANSHVTIGNQIYRVEEGSFTATEHEGSTEIFALQMAHKALNEPGRSIRKMPFFNITDVRTAMIIALIGEEGMAPLEATKYTENIVQQYVSKEMVDAVHQA